MKKKNNHEQGFTLIEMMVVLFIIGIIIAIALPNFKSAGETAIDRADQVNRQLISNQADQYFLEYGRYPKTVEELVEHKFLNAVPKCPGGKGKYVISSDPNLPSEQRVKCQK